MKRRSFIKLSLAAITALVLPAETKAAVNLANIEFSTTIANNNSAQTIIIYLYGGASMLAGNITNLDEIKEKSQSDYDNYFGTITPTANDCWEEAGGAHMEALMDSGDMTLFRTCFSDVREESNNKAHGLCTSQNQKGSFDEEDDGIVTKLAHILEVNGIVNEDSVMPFITLDGESAFYSQEVEPLPAYLKAVGMNSNLDNPYERSLERLYTYYTAEERAVDGYNTINPALQEKMNSLAQGLNIDGKMKEAFDKRVELEEFINNIKTSVTPDLGVDAYPANNSFADNIETAIKVLVNNADTKVITIGTGGLGGWDEHDQAIDYVSRSESLFSSLRSAMAHLKAEVKDGSINIMVFGEFGRNVNLNTSFGWDHGNLQNFYLLGGKDYFNHQGVVGETSLYDTGSINRLFLHPADGSYKFEPLSIASTIYNIYGITNPEILTNNNLPIDI